MIATGIYGIQSKIAPTRCYVGSSVDINGRWKDHQNELKRGVHKNIKLQRHYNKYGESDLIYLIICHCTKDELIRYEQKYIDELHPYFNISLTAGSTLGCKCSNKTKKKIAKSKKGKKASEETRIKMSEIRKQFRWSDEIKAKMSKSAIGNKNAEGTICFEETKEKIRVTKIGNTWGFKKGNKINVGKKASQETRKKLSGLRQKENNPWYGKHPSEEVRQKMRDAWARRKQKKAA